MVFWWCPKLNFSPLEHRMQTAGRKTPFILTGKTGLCSTCVSISNTNGMALPAADVPSTSGFCWATVWWWCPDSCTLLAPWCPPAASERSSQISWKLPKVAGDLIWVNFFRSQNDSEFMSLPWSNWEKNSKQLQEFAEWTCHYLRLPQSFLDLAIVFSIVRLNLRQKSTAVRLLLSVMWLVGKPAISFPGRVFPWCSDHCGTVDRRNPAPCGMYF